MKSLNKIATIATSLILAISLSGAAQAKTTRTTTVKIENHTGKTVEYASVVHKYSDVFKSSKNWGTLATGRRSSSTMSIRYNTGFGTSGQDWWSVAYKLSGENFVRYTNPRNGRSIIDGVERFAKSNAAKLVKDLEEIKADSVKKAVIKRAGIAVITQSSKYLLNSGTTAGMKKHLLRSKDQAGGVTIKLFADSKVGFYSKTGTSITGASTRSLVSN